MYTENWRLFCYLGLLLGSCTQPTMVEQPGGKFKWGTQSPVCPSTLLLLGSPNPNISHNSLGQDSRYTAFRTFGSGKKARASNL